MSAAGGAARRAGLNVLLLSSRRAAAAPPADEAAAATHWLRWRGDEDDEEHRRQQRARQQLVNPPTRIAASEPPAPAPALSSFALTAQRPPTLGLASLVLLAEKQRQQHHHHHCHHRYRRALATSAAPREQSGSSSSSSSGGNGGGSPAAAEQQEQQPRQQQPLPPPPPPPPQPHSLSDVQGLLDSLSALRLREELAAASGATPYVPHARLLEMVREMGAADTAAEAERVADALVRAGVVLRLGGVVYLRPHEVAEMVLASVPSDGSAAAQRLGEIERDLERLDRAHADIVAQARRWPRFWLGAGCAAFAAQLAGFIYLCYWELSWDVVEPLACFVSMGWTLVAWLYFLARGSALDYDAFDSHWTQTGLEKRMAARGFDPERHEQLALARDRYRRYLTAQRAAALAEGVPAGGPVSRAATASAGAPAGGGGGGE